MAVVDGAKKLFLNDHHRTILRRDYLKRPFEGLSSLLRGANNTVREAWTFNVPVRFFKHNPTTYRDLINPHNMEGSTHMQQLLFLFSAVVSDGSFGTPVGTDAFRGPADLAGRGGGGADQAPLNPPAPGGGLGRSAGRGRGGGAGGPPLPGGAPAILDTRGIISDDGRSLTFRVAEDNYRAKVVPAVEELLSPTDRVVAYRFWFFVLDPNLHLAQAIAHCLQRNAVLYTNPANAPDEYITHSSIRTATQFVDHILIPYVQQGMHEGMPLPIRRKFHDLLSDWRDPVTVQTMSNLALHAAQHPAHPKRVLGKFGGFNLYLDGVREEQCNPANYFTLISNEALLDPMAEDSAALMSGRLAFADANEDYLPEAPEEDGAAPLAPPPPPGASAIGQSEDALLEEALLEVTRMTHWDDRQEEERRSAEAAAGPGQSATPAVSAAARQHDEAVHVSRIEALENTPDSHLARDCFPRPEHVCHIPSRFFGRLLLNLPLPHLLDFTGKAATTDGVDRFHLIREQFKGRHLPVGGPEVVRRVLELELRKIPTHDRIELLPHHLSTEDGFREVLMTVAHALASSEEEKGLEVAARDVVAMMSGQGQLSFSDEQDSDFDKGMVFSGSLPEFTRQRITRHDFQYFAKKNAFLQQRMENAYDFQDVTRRYPQGTPDHVEKVREFRHERGHRFMNILMNSQLLPESVKKMCNTYRGWRFEFRHGEHLDMVANLSSYANLQLNLVSRYTGYFRGSTNQSVYMLSKLVVYGSFVYDWELRPNLLLLGQGSVGKSYIFEVLEIMSIGGFAVVGHSTERAYSTSTDFSDETTCMHEAPLSFIGVDKYGRSILPDESFKDRLTRNRTTTRAFYMDEQKNRLTKTEQAMIMGNILMASNDMIPPEDQPLMQRFICKVVNDMKRPDFRRGDQSFPLQDLIDDNIGKRLMHQEHLLYWYVFLACKLIMCMVLPDVSTDGADLLVREILERYAERVGTITDQTRKRKMILSVLVINCIVYAVHMACFSIIAQSATKEKDAATGELRHKDFDICRFIDEVGKRLFITDEQVVDIMTRMGFMWDTEHRLRILGAVAHKICSGPESADAYPERKSNLRFMRVPNPDYEFTGHHHGGGGGGHYGKDGGGPSGQGKRGGPGTHDAFSKLLAEAKAAEQPKKGGAVQAPPSGAPTHDDADPSAQVGEETPQFILDHRYVAFYGLEIAPMYARIVACLEGDKPSEVEVMRQLRDASRSSYEAHPVHIEEWTPEQEMQRRRKIALTRRAELEAAETDEDFEEIFERLVREKERRPGYRLETDPDAEFDEKGNLSATSVRRWHWQLKLDEPTTTERIVIIERNPANPKEMMIAVLLEYVIMNRKKDAMLGAVVDVLSSNCMPKEGATFITSLPYLHEPTREFMPQFMRTLHIPWQDKPIVCHFPNLGTLDANTFSRATMRFAKESATHDPTNILRNLRGAAGLVLADQDPNIYFAWRHWMRSGYDVTKEEFVTYTPAWDSERCRQLMENLEKKPESDIKRIMRYPEESVEYLLARRRLETLSRDPANSSIYDLCYVKTTDMMIRGTKEMKALQASVLDPDRAAEEEGPLVSYMEIVGEKARRKAARKLNKAAGVVYTALPSSNPHYSRAMHQVDKSKIDEALALYAHLDVPAASSSSSSALRSSKQQRSARPPARQEPRETGGGGQKRPRDYQEEDDEEADRPRSRRRSEEPAPQASQALASPPPSPSPRPSPAEQGGERGQFSMRIVTPPATPGPKNLASRLAQKFQLPTKKTTPAAAPRIVVPNLEEIEAAAARGGGGGLKRRSEEDLHEATRLAADAQEGDARDLKRQRLVQEQVDDYM